MLTDLRFPVHVSAFPTTNIARGCWFNPLPVPLAAPRIVSPLPLREGGSSREGSTSSSTATRLGKGTSPCWQHVMCIPLPAEIPLVDDIRESGQVRDGSAPDPNPVMTGRRPQEICPPKALVSPRLSGVSSRVESCLGLAQQRMTFCVNSHRTPTRPHTHT